MGIHRYIWDFPRHKKGRQIWIFKSKIKTKNSIVPSNLIWRIGNQNTLPTRMIRTSKDQNVENQNIKSFTFKLDFRRSDITYGVKKDQNIKSLIWLLTFWPFSNFHQLLNVWRSDFQRSDPFPSLGYSYIKVSQNHLFNMCSPTSYRSQGHNRHTLNSSQFDSFCLIWKLIFLNWNFESLTTVKRCVQSTFAFGTAHYSIC